MISHRSACPVSLAGDSLLQTLSKYTCYSFPTRQRRLARPDKAIYPSPAQPVQTLSLMFSLLQEINMFGSRQTTRLCQAGSSRLAGHHWGPWQQMYTSESTRSAPPESTLDTINSKGSTLLRMINAAHMCHTRDQHSSSFTCQVVPSLPESKPPRGYWFRQEQGELLLKFKATGISTKVYSDTKLEHCTVQHPGNVEDRQSQTSQTDSMQQIKQWYKL